MDETPPVDILQVPIDARTNEAERRDIILLSVFVLVFPAPSARIEMAPLNQPSPASCPFPDPRSFDPLADEPRREDGNVNPRRFSRPETWTPLKTFPLDR